MTVTVVEGGVTVILLVYLWVESASVDMAVLGVYQQLEGYGGTCYYSSKT